MEKHAIINIDVLTKWLESIKADFEDMSKPRSTVELGNLIEFLKKSDPIKVPN